jgi:SAM-dependent methyltransferase
VEQNTQGVNWHARYLQQAAWTRPLRDYLFSRTGLENASRVLEVGCGSGAILSEFTNRPCAIYGLDNQSTLLEEARLHAPEAQLICADAHIIPYPNHTFDISYCHFLLLWVQNPLQVLREMNRVTRPGGTILALAEPDYIRRIDQPEALIPLGRWQTESLQKQGADPGLGFHLADLFHKAGIQLIETGTLDTAEDHQPAPEERGLEWDVLASDLSGIIPAREFQRLKLLDEQAWAQGQRILHVPTYFAFGRM